VASSPKCKHRFVVEGIHEHAYPYIGVTRCMVPGRGQAGFAGDFGRIGPWLCRILDMNFGEDLFHALRCIRAVGAPTLALLLPRLSHIRLSNPPCLAYYYYFALYETTSPAVTWGGFGAK
jgi:hypothetical protein